MKTYLSLVKLLGLIFLMSFISCDLLDKDDTLSTEDAKVEIRAAGDEIMMNVAQMMSTPAMNSLMFFSMFMDMDDISLKASGLVFGDIGLKPLLTAKNDMNGVYHFNFLTEEFDLVNPGVNYMEFHFPGDEQAYQNSQRNAVVRISNLTYIEFYDEYWDEWDILPTRADIAMTVDGQTAFTLNYQASFNNEGLPTAVSIDMNMTPYSMTMNFQGSGTSYTSKMSLKMNNSTLASFDLAIRYTSDMEDVERISGDVRVTPLKVKGNVKALAMEECDYNDVGCMNNNLDAELWHTGLDKAIGDIEFRMVGGEATPVVVYKDGSYETLEQIFGDYFEGF